MLNFLKVNSPKSVDKILSQDVKQASKEVAKYRDAIADVQSKIQDLKDVKKAAMGAASEADSKIVLCVDEANRLMESMTTIMRLIENYKSFKD